MRTVFIITAAALSLCACANTTALSARGQSDASYSYVCDSGNTVIARYPSDSTAIVRYLGATYKMQIAVSASGARYVGNGMQWWTKGSGAGSHGTMFKHNADTTAGQRLESCIRE